MRGVRRRWLGTCSVRSHRAPGPPDVASARAHYGSALTLAKEIGMQPLVAHCHAGLARLCRKTGDPSAADAHFATAAALYRAMGMAHWLEQQR